MPFCTKAASSEVCGAMARWPTLILPQWSQRPAPNRFQPVGLDAVETGCAHSFVQQPRKPVEEV
jgi:hypothetical protein